MATSHLCRNHPDLEKDGERWREGGVDSCPHHGHKGFKQLGFKEGRADRRRKDREAGVVGRESQPGGYIHGS